MRQIRTFEMHALHRALDYARQARGLTWVALAAEINEPFVGTPSIPISVGTLRDMHKKSSVTSGVVLQVLRWLCRTPESFLTDGTLAPPAGAQLPEPGRRASFASIPAECSRHSMPTPQPRYESEGSGLTITGVHGRNPQKSRQRTVNWLSPGHLIPQWLGLPAADFVRVDKR